MGQRIPINLGLGSYETASKPFSSQRCVNLYANIAQAGALSDFGLFSTPGISSFGTTSQKPSRGAYVMNGVYYVVTGQTLYSVDEDGSGTSLGTINGTDRVIMVGNGWKLAILAPDVASNNLWEWDTDTTTLTQVSDSDYRVAADMDYKDGFFCFIEKDENVFFCSNLNQPLVFDALDFTNADLSPGPCLAIHASQDEVFVFKRDMCEVYQNIGGADFPFQRIPGASFETGARSPYSIKQWGDVFYFIGGGVNEKACVFMASGSGMPKRLSTDAIESEIQMFTEAEIADSFCYSYSIKGVSLIGFTIESANRASRTFVYNVTASELSGKKVWSEQQSGISEDNWRAASVNFVYDTLLVSDLTDGRIGELSENVNTEYGASILREKSSPTVSNQGNSMFINEIELTIEPGTGTATGQGLNPQVMLDWSDTGGKLWSNEIWRPMGVQGNYLNKVVWRRLGRSPSHRVFRFRVSDPVDVNFLKAEIEVSFGG